MYICAIELKIYALFGGSHDEKTSDFILITVISLMILVGFIYNQFYSLSAVLHEFDFSKEDIVTSKDNSRDAAGLNRLLLLSNQDQLGLVIAHKNKYGLWKREGIASVEKELSNGQYVLLSMNIPEEYEKGELRSGVEKYIFLAAYIDEPISTNTFIADDFQLKIEQFAVNERKLLFVEAKADIDKTNFGSDEIIDYLQEEFDIFK